MQPNFRMTFFVTAQTAFHHCTFGVITAHFLHHCTLKQALPSLDYFFQLLLSTPSFDGSAEDLMMTSVNHSRLDIRLMKHVFRLNCFIVAILSTRLVSRL